MPEKKLNENEIKFEINLNFIDKIRKGIHMDQKTKNVVIMQRDEDASIYTAIDEENVLLGFST